MREILFRGKRIDNGEWAYGSLIEQNNPEYHTYIVRSFLAEIDKENIDVTNLDIVEVDPNTVGQYNGMLDKNGTKIFGGDILDFSDRSDGDGYGVVVYDTNETEFGIVYDSIYEGLGRQYHSRNIEVVGNIFDNPGLLEDVKNE